MNDKWLVSNERINALTKFHDRLTGGYRFDIQYYVLEKDTHLNFHLSLEFKNARLKYKQKIKER